MVAQPQYVYRSAVVGELGPEDASRVMGTYLTCKGIHLPKDPSLSTLARDERALWDAAVANAARHYGKREIAEKTAWKAHRLFFLNGQRRSALPSLPRVSSVGDPGNLVRFGVIIEYSYIDEQANLQHFKFLDDAPNFYWSDSTKSIIVVPGERRSRGLKNPDVCMLPTPGAAETIMYKRWTQRDATCVKPVEIPEVPLTLVGNIDTFVYRSDKWHDANPQDTMVGSQEYIHQFGDGVGLWVAPGKSGRAPRVMVVTGGCLDAEERGIIH